MSTKCRRAETQMVVNQTLQNELLAMREEDDRVRSELVASGDLFGGYDPRMAAVHAQNARKLDAIIERHGWPGRSLVGDDGAEAAWLVLQHAIGHPALLRKCVPLLRESAKLREIEPHHVAYLEDRICVLEGRPQRYGTQFDWDEHGQLNPLPLQDSEHVDSYRASVGLGPLAERLAQARRRAQAERETPPLDFEQRQAAKEAWAKSVGWL